MPNFNSVLILKQLEQGYSTENRALSGIVRIEKEFGVAELSATFVNLSALIGGSFYLYIFGEKSAVYTFELSSRPLNLRKTLEGLTELDKGFASALVAVRADIPVTVAYGCCQGFDFTLSRAKKLIAEKCLDERRSSKRKAEITEPIAPPPVELEPNENEQSQEQAKTQSAAYDDEAVATVNYYQLDEELKGKLDKIKEWNNEELSNENGNASDICQEKEKENAFGADFLQDEADNFANQNDTLPFYITAERELETLFNKFPPYDKLLGFFPDSKWVKINYDKNKYYVVGVIKENKKEKYVCYGVPAKYSPTPPQELKGYCTFIPLSIFDMQGEGFWMMFQDAVTGESIINK